MATQSGQTAQRRYKVAVVGATGLVGEALLEFLATRDFPVAELWPLATENSSGKRIEFQGNYRAVKTLAGFDFSAVDIAFFCVPAEVAREAVERAREAGCLAIDTSEAFRDEVSTPMCLPGVSAPLSIDLTRGAVLAQPGGVSAAVARILAPVYALSPIKHVDLVTFQAAAGCGRAGVTELARQTTQILSLQSVESPVFSRQLAFNVLPRIDEPQVSGYTREELNLTRDLHRIFADETFTVNALCTRVPVFFGDAVAVTVDTLEPLKIQRLRESWRDCAGIEMITDSDEEAYPTAVEQAAGDDALFIGRLRQDPANLRRFSLWLVSDNVRKGAALNSIQIAELAINEYI